MRQPRLRALRRTPSAHLTTRSVAAYVKVLGPRSQLSRVRAKELFHRVGAKPFGE